MNENKRIFLTGALIAGLLLVTPYYLQLIGFQAEEPVKAPDSASTTEEFFIEGPVKNTEPSKSFSLSEKFLRDKELNELTVFPINSFFELIVIIVIPVANLLSAFLKL